jgi:hypothetical protein
MFSASIAENENAEGTLLEMKLGTVGGCPKQQDSKRVAHPGPTFGRECEMQPVNASTPVKGMLWGLVIMVWSLLIHYKMKMRICIHT